MSDQTPTSGIEVYVRGNVTQNSRGHSKEHTISVKARIEGVSHGPRRLTLMVTTDDGEPLDLRDLLDALHQEADAANQREIQHQQREQLAAIQAGS